MRKSTDPCLLCQHNPASKTNSHILPKFLSTNFLGAKGFPRKGFDISSDGNKPKTIQDSPKENFILCEECEAYFSVIEGISSNTFINWKAKVDKGEFTIKNVPGDIKLVECITADKKSMHLLVYSVFWRASISGHDLFDNFKLEPSFEEMLRKCLLKFRHAKRTDFLNAISSDSIFDFYPYSSITASSFSDKTANFLLAPKSFDPYSLIIDRFGFLLYTSANELDHELIKPLCNLTVDDCQMIVFTEQGWYDTIIKRAFNLLAKKTNQNKN